MANPSQLFLLADHIKLSLLERQRAISLNIETNAQDGHISRSLDSMREGVEALEQERTRVEETGDLYGLMAHLLTKRLTWESVASSTLQDQASRLRSQYDDLTSQFRGFPTATASSTTTRPNDSSLSPDFAHARSPNPRTPSSSVLKRSAQSPNISKSVRFTDNPKSNPDYDDQANQAALLPYRDEPEGPPDQSELNNQQIHAYHKSVLQDQDKQLDRLGDSIGRQRELSIQIGDELDDQVQMLDDVEDHVDRHQTTLARARKALGDVARKSKDNKQLTIILILIIVLVLLIIILKR